MAVAFTIADGALFCVWGQPTLADVENVLRELRAAAAKARGPVVYVTRLPSDAPAPSPEVRAYLNSVMPVITTLCSSYHVVLEGSGFLAAVKRSVLISLFQISPRRNTFFVHATVDGVASKVPPEKHAVLKKLLQQADRDGLLDCPAIQASPAAGWSGGTASPPNE